jgi:hypothetical protein
LVLYESAEEILDAPDYDLLATAWEPDCFYIGFRHSAIYLHAVLDPTAGSQREESAVGSQPLAGSL